MRVRPGRRVSCESARARVVAIQPVLAPGGEASRRDRLARGAHQRHQKMYIVQGEQSQPEDLVGDEEVPDVRARESRTRDTVALLVQRPRVGSVLGALDVEPAGAGEDGTVAAHPG